MPTEILMPALSPTMEEGTLAKWHVKEGDEVRTGDVIAEIETDKATMEVEAIDDGKVGKLLVPEGTEHVPVNQPIALLLTDGEDSAASFETRLSAAPQDEGLAPHPDGLAPHPEEGSPATVSKAEGHDDSLSPGPSPHRGEGDFAQMAKIAEMIKMAPFQSPAEASAAERIPILARYRRRSRRRRRDHNRRRPSRAPKQQSLRAPRWSP